MLYHFYEFDPTTLLKKHLYITQHKLDDHSHSYAWLNHFSFYFQVLVLIVVVLLLVIVLGWY